MGNHLGREDLEAATPSLTGHIALKGLEHRVEIHRDHYGVPHVRARSVHDAFFAQGFVHAQDRLWQMDLDRRRAHGRAAEFLGSRLVSLDVFARRTRLGSSAEGDYQALKGDTRAMLEAYVAGVNGFIDHMDCVPIEYKILGEVPEPWTPWDPCAVFKIRHIFMGTWQNKLLRARLLTALGPELTARMRPEGQGDEVLIVPSEEGYGRALLDMDELTAGGDASARLPELGGGSNSWAVHGRLTASGKPLVAGDPHRALEVPNVYYQNHLCCPEFDVIGLSFPGVPGFPHFGHNDRVAWCVTHAMADYQDLFVERFNPDDPSQYEFKGAWRAAKRYRETIRVREAAEVEIEVTVTHHGPIVIGDPGRGHAIALRYTAIAEPATTLDAFLPMLKAKSMEAFEEAMGPWVDPCNNLMMADVSGNIGYLTRGRLPLRSKANAWLPVPGWTGEHEWEGVVPFEEMPRLRNPDIGYIVTANNRIVGHDYPHYIALDYVPPHRARRIVDRLGALSGATVDDMASIHGDRVSIPGRFFVERLEGIPSRDDRYGEALEYLRQWDGKMDRDSVGGTIYTVTRDQLMRIVLSEPKLRPLRTNPFPDEPKLPGMSPELRTMWLIVPVLLRENDTTLLQEGEDWQGLLGEALSRAMEWLSGILGPDMKGWQWGKLHRTLPMHPIAAVHTELGELLNPPSVSIGGDGDTPQAAWISPGVSHDVTLTSVARYVFDLSDWDNSAWIVPLGSSGHPGSPHYADQADLWSDLKLIPMPYTWDRIMGEAETAQQLEPTT